MEQWSQETATQGPGKHCTGGRDGGTALVPGTRGKGEEVSTGQRQSPASHTPVRGVWCLTGAGRRAALGEGSHDADGQRPYSQPTLSLGTGTEEVATVSALEP